MLNTKICNSRLFDRLFLILFISCTISCSNDDSPAQDDDSSGDTDFQGTVDWVKTFGGSQEDEALSIVETTDNGYLVFGYTQSTDGDITDKTATDSDFWALKLTQDGSVSWSKTYGGSGDDRGQKLIRTSDNGYVMVGYSRSTDGDVSTNAGLQDYWIVKIDASGTIIWEKTFGFPGIDRAFSVVQTTDGGYFITGFLDVTASNGEGNDDGFRKHGVGEFWGIKLNASGEREWRRYFGGTDNDRSYDTVQTEDGGFLMIGSSESTDFDITNSQGSYDFWVVKVNSSGTKVWEKSYGGTEIDIAYAISSAGNGRYTIVGDSRSNDGNITQSNGNADLWMIQIDGNGNLIWEKSLGGTQFDTGRGIYPIQSGGFVITGNSRSNDNDLDQNNGQSDVWTLIVDNNGEISWKSSIGGSAEEFATGVIQTADKKIVIAGSSASNNGDITENKGLKDALIIKYK